MYEKDHKEENTRLKSFLMWRYCVLSERLKAIANCAYRSAELCGEYNGLREEICAEYSKYKAISPISCDSTQLFNGLIITYNKFRIRMEKIEDNYFPMDFNHIDSRTYIKRFEALKKDVYGLCHIKINEYTNTFAKHAIVSIGTSCINSINALTLYIRQIRSTESDRVLRRLERRKSKIEGAMCLVSKNELVKDCTAKEFCKSTMVDIDLCSKILTAADIIMAKPNGESSDMGEPSKDSTINGEADPMDIQ